MDVFDLYAKISLDTSGYESGLQDASKTTQSFGSKLGAGLKSAAKLAGTAITAASTAAVAFGASAVKAGADFDSSMSQVAATMGKTVDEIQNLRDFAQEMGSTTAFSASQAADALNYMALAGYDAEKSMEMLPNVLNLAAAGSIDLAYASDMVTDAASALGLNTEQTTAMIDQFAAAASKSNTSVTQLGEAILTIGATAANVKGGTQELSTVLGALADNGIKGSEGGTHLRNMLISLQDACEDGAVSFGDFAVEVYDADGNMRSMLDIIGDMQAGMEGMTQEAKDALISGVFNKTDLSSVNALLKTTTERFEELGEAIGDSAGAAEKMAATQLDNLAGDVTLFKSALEGAQIALSDQLTPSLREFVQFGSSALSTLTESIKSGGLTEAMSGLGTIIADGLSMAVKGLPGAIDAGVELLRAVGRGIMENIDVLVWSAWDAVHAFFEGMLNATEGEGSAILEIIQWIVGAFVENSADILQIGVQIVANIINGIAQGIGDLIEELPYYIEVITLWFLKPDTWKNLISAGTLLIKNLLTGVIKAVPMLIRYIPEIIGYVLNVVKEGLPIIIETMVELVNMIVEELPNIITALTEAIPEILDMLVDTLITLLPVLINGIIQVVVAITEHLPEIIQALIDAIPIIIQAFINAWMTAIPAVVQGIIQLVTALIPHIPEIIAILITSIPQIIEAIIEGFRPLVERVVGLFGEIGNAISTWWAGKKQDIANGWADFLASAKEWFDQLPYNLGYALADMIVKFGDWYIQAKDWVATNVSKLIESIVNWFAGLPNKIWNWLLETITRIGNWIKDTDDKVKAELPVVIDGIVKFFEELPGRAWDWGVDMINSFINGIASMAQAAWDSVEGFVQGIADRIGHSHPKTGPLAKDYEWMPDMMQQFAEGITDNAYLVDDAIEKSLDFSDAIVSPEVEYNRLYQSDTSGALNQVVALLQDIVEYGLSLDVVPREDAIFDLVNRKNRENTRATGYNTLASAGG